MKLLVTGANGFTGQHLCRVAQADGLQVHALQADLLNPAALHQELQAVQPDAVAHLAAISFVAHDRPAQIYEVNTIGSMNLLDALAALPRPPRVLLASSANVYGNCLHSPVAETQSPAPVNHYAASKLAMEHLARTRLDALDLFITRPFNYTGTGQAGQFLIPKLIDHFARRAPVIELGNLDVAREFNDVRFVAHACLQLLRQADRGATYNLCTGHAYTLREVVARLTALTGHTPELKVNPQFVRRDEIPLLCGDPSVLQARVSSLKHYALDETLGWMLDAATTAS